MDADVIETYVELGMGIGIGASIAFDAERDRTLRARDDPIGRTFARARPPRDDVGATACFAAASRTVAPAARQAAVARSAVARPCKARKISRRTSSGCTGFASTRSPAPTATWILSA